MQVDVLSEKGRRERDFWVSDTSQLLRVLLKGENVARNPT